MRELSSTIYSTPRDENGLIRNDEPNTPTSIRVDPEGNVVVLFEGDGSVQQFDPKGNRTTLLAPGVINKPSDIALSSDGSLFVSSMTAGVVFRVAMDGSVIPVAGTESTLATAMDGVMALESYLGSPVSIDFDSLNRLYIADNMFGSIRVVTTDGIISTITDNDNRVMDVAQLRVNNHGMTTLYATHTLGHRLTRVQYKTVSNSSRFKYIHYPYYIILKEGIYGLEEPIKAAVESALGDLVPKEKVSIFTKISDRNRRIAAYLKSHPLLFGILLVLLNQGVSAALSDGVQLTFHQIFHFKFFHRIRSSKELIMRKFLLISVLLGSLALAQKNNQTKPSFERLKSAGVQMNSEQDAVPRRLSYQGLLTKANGRAVSDGTYQVTFKLFEQSEGGTAFWEETQSIGVSDGVISATLGIVNAITSVPANSYLEIAVDETTLSPRQK